MPERAAVLGWASPWSGDDNDLIPRRYWLWHRLYTATRRVKHWVGWHDWEIVGVADRRDDPVYAYRCWHCHWCGADKDIS